MSYFVYFVIIISFFDTFSQLPIMSPYAKELGGSSNLRFFSLGVVIGPLIVGILDVSPNIGFIIGFIGVFLVLLILYSRRNLANSLEYVEQQESS